ncbi:hypothetical protein GW17_00060517 [Ensete ventricosum]|nr:hypothetical protein GW17_00060517 [Ensete ventricosum]
MKGKAKCCVCTNSLLETISITALLIGPNSSTATRHRNCDHRTSRRSSSRRRMFPSRTVLPRRLRSLRPPNPIILCCRCLFSRPPHHRITGMLLISTGIATQATFAMMR